MRKIVPLVAFLIVAGLAIAAQAAPMAYMTVTATKQGQFKGDTVGKERKDAIIVLGFTLEMDSPHDIATGQASGKRQHKPLLITKEVDASSPQFFEAIA